MKTIFTILICILSSLAVFADPCENFYANFGYNNPNGGLVVLFNNLSEGDASEVLWSFGDGTESDALNPQHTYTTEGTYEICLTIENPTCHSETCKSVIIPETQPPICEAAFSYTMNGSTLVFDNNSVTSLNDFTHYIWHFGDETQSDNPNPTHTYAANGVYQVCLTVWNNETNCEDQVCQTITINNVPTPCEAAFTYTMNGSTLMFDNNSVTSLNDFTHYIWHFGDETQSDNPNPTHTYAANGVYQVCLTVWNNETNCEDQVCQTITINSIPNPCEAAFSYTMNGSTLVFDNNSVTSLNDFTHYIWHFGDETQSDNPNPTHTYAANGTYQVCLTVWNNETNCEDQVCQTITINSIPNPCEAAFSYTINGSTLVFDNNSVTSLNDFTHYIWHFGDETQSDNPNPTHTYAANGVYQVCLTVWNNETNCEDQVCQTITINNVPTPCEAAFSYVVNGNVAVFTNTSTVGNANAYQSIWYNNETAVSTQQNTSITFPANGSYNICLVVYNDDINCEDQVCQTITINNVPTPCEAAFTYTINGSTLVFDNNSVTSLNDFTHYIWHFGDETQSDNPNPTHTYAANGTYQVCLTVWNNETNCEDQVCQTITINSIPTPCEAAFSYTINGSTLVFDNNSVTSLNDFTHYIWHFGDETQSDNPNPTHTYAANGVYQVCLTVWNNETNCEDQVCQTITINNVPTPCEAAFSYTINGSTLVFDNNSVTSLNDFTHYIWHFGDETQSDNPNPTHTYAANGVYQVCLTVWNNETNCEDQVCQTITINSIPNPCEAAFTYTMNGSTLVFDNNSVTSLNDFTHYIWHFGDETQSDNPNPTHTYAANGTYQVCLTVWNNETNCEDQVCQTITINNVPNPCEAAFSYTMNGSTLVFDNNSVTSLNDFTHYIWHFGDETQSDLANPTHTYAANGVYQVCLTVWNNETNCEDQVCQTITINNVPTPCEAAFTYTMNGSTLVFDNNSVTSLNDFTHYIWHFGDETQSDNPNPTHTYAANGVYQVCLTVWNNETNCEDQVCQTITINNVPTPCEAAFTYVVNGNVAVFTNTSTVGNANTYQSIWYNNETAVSTQQNTSITFPANGSYNICLVVYNDDINCEDQVCQTITINNVPTPCEAAFTYTMNGSTLVFDNNSVTSLNDFTHYIWHFGDETQSDLANPTHTYAANGVYQVCLTVWNNETNCEDQVCQTITIAVEPPVTCEASFVYETNLFTAYFNANNSSTSSGEIVSYQWTLGDGATSDSPTPTHIYTANGTYQVCLSITTNNGCTDEHCGNVVIDAGQMNGLRINPNTISNGILNMEVTLMNPQHIHIGIFNSVGQDCFNQNTNLPAGNTPLQLYTANTPTGVYFVQILFDNGFSMMQKVLITP